MTGWRRHPCFSCTLPDCDEAHFNCNLKKANRAYANARKRGDDLTPYRPGYNAWFLEFHEEGRRKKQGRPPRDVVALVERGAA